MVKKLLVTVAVVVLISIIFVGIFNFNNSTNIKEQCKQACDNKKDYVKYKERTSEIYYCVCHSQAKGRYFEIINISDTK